MSGITSNTYKEIIIDEAVAYKNYGETSQALIGATRGGTGVQYSKEIKEMAVDGARGPIKGFRRVISTDAKMTMNFLQIGVNLLKLAMPGSTSTAFPTSPSIKTHDQITDSLTIALTDYLVNVALVGKIQGTNIPIVCILHNPLASGSLDIQFVDREEAVLAVEFTGHFNPATPTVIPFEIRYPILPVTVVRTTAALPQTTSAAIFNVNNGRIGISKITGEVTTVIQDQANNVKLISDPTAGEDADICATLNVAADVVGSIYGITGISSEALVSYANAAAYVAQTYDVIVNAGSIDLSCSASNTGSVKWTIEYYPIDEGAVVVAA